ncbi:septal ring lytic transglycosylase RlpA family protein [Aurantiacibacter luteus]|uniref:Endolytic peptidoglycan transglycosylase RlpA n=1 Tax=Aurantiacibacter luteus TaxID=1581420 RepID=A0A0G9N2S8_9SPHN|nr:septal ring lytic transglycosylase RlpA family protein [Aurantiacibacter luteus]KLE35838.1 hypothetical protein AAW00_05575 [Aurantiacibacter luteus]
MDGKAILRRTAPRLAAALAGLALIAATGTGHAEDERAPAPAASIAAAAAATPVFVPSEEAAFEEAFAAFDAPVEPLLPGHAVDITEVEPAVDAATTLDSGVASYYADRFNGRRTASGETFSNRELTAAHRTLPFGSRVRVTNPRTGDSVVVRINDRGPFSGNRTIDLSRAAAEQVGIVRAGHGTVELALLD